MDEQRQKLLDLIMEMNFPVTEQEAIANIKGYTDQEVADLVSLYSDVSTYENDMEEFVRENAPDEYKRLVEERDENLKKKASEYEYELEKAQENEDLELDSLDIQEEREIEETVKPIEELAVITEETADEIEKAVKSSEPASLSV